MVNIFCLFRPLLGMIDPETSHKMAVAGLKNGLYPRPAPFEDPILESRLWGIDFTNPVGLAAGFDKNAEAVDALLGMGFGFVEVGSVTPRPQPGNPRPRLFRLSGDGAVINRMGFNNDGMDAVAQRLRGRGGGIVGVNLGKNKDTANAGDDYAAGIRVLAGLCDYVVINISSPNTPGLRALQERRQLHDLLESVISALGEYDDGKRPPLLLKIAPDLGDEDKSDIVEVALELAIDGIIATNTTIERPDTLTSSHRGEGGGLSGRPLFTPSTRVLADIYRLSEGKIPLVGVGGISSAEDAYEKIRAGASLVQLYTGLIYHGPGLVNRIKRGLAERLRADGFSCLSEVVGAEHR